MTIQSDILAVSHSTAVDQEPRINPRSANDSSQSSFRRTGALRPVSRVAEYISPSLDDDAPADFALREREKVAVDLPVTLGVRPQM